MDQNKKNPSLLPILLLGLSGVFVYQLWFEKESTLSPPEQVTSSPKEFLRKSEVFDISKNRGKKTNTEITTKRFIVQFDSQGAKISRLYIKNSGALNIPSRALKEQNDVFGQENQALEITQNWGLDFQPHLYWRDNLEDNIATPYLNQAVFTVLSNQVLDELQAKQLVYSLRFKFKNHSLRLLKYYIFFEDELFFRQLSVIQNLSTENFTLEYTDDQGEKKYGNLYFKVFSDLGPKQDKASTVNNSNGKFFYYNDELINRADVYNSGGFNCFPFQCTSPDQSGLYSVYLNSPNTLNFFGTRSRYFFAYSEHLTPTNMTLHRPDGFIYRNTLDKEHGESQTTVFLNFALAGIDKKSFRWQQLQLNNEPASDAYTQWNTRIRDIQKKHRDLLLIDQKIYLGPRTADSHVFVDNNNMQKAFSITENNPYIGQVIYSGLSRFFSIINQVIFFLLKFFYQITNNYGVSIICIALLIKLATFPLNNMQTKSMKKMADLKPEIDRINKKFKSNAMEKQKHLMEIYKRHNINPARGCLPILIQMPIFFSLYTVFSESIELWKSPFMLWITDLSAPDSIFVIPGIDINFNILPLIMAGTQFLQQTQMTAPTNPQQKILMKLMPLIMIVFFWQIPSGVTLYWTMQNIITIVWQMMAKDKK